MASTKTYILKRVPYGKKSTPIKDREYKIDGRQFTHGAVGTKKEWRVFAKKNKIKIRFKE